MKKAPHTSTHPGKRVCLVLRDGSRVVSRFKERTGQFVVLASGRYQGREIARFQVLKGA